MIELESVGSYTGTCKDCIYYTVSKDYENNVCEACNSRLKHGEWAGTVCTNCGESTSDYYDCDYCPKCGAKMDL